MNTATDTILEQLSALMDGELPETEARFLLRRIQGDPGLHAKWARMQVASSCIKGQPWTPSRPDLCAGVDGQIAGAASQVSRHGMLRWGMAASLLAVAVLLGPRLMHSTPASGPVLASSAPMQRADHLIASPGSADLVAARVDSSVPSRELPRPGVGYADPVGGNPALVASNAPASRVESPLPLSAQSPTEFPLVESADKRSWPRSGLAQATDDPAIEAYLVRHNQMLANDGLGGFVPYLDVVATDQADSSAFPSDGEAESTAGRGDVQQ
jgi:hypothetical protein